MLAGLLFLLRCPMPLETNSPYTLISGALTTEYVDAPDNTQPRTNIYRVLINYSSNRSQMTVAEGAVIEAIGAMSTGILAVTDAQIAHNGAITTSWIGVALEAPGSLYVGPSGTINSAQAVRLRQDGTSLINDGTLMASLVGVEGWDSVNVTNNGSISGIAGMLIYGTANQPNTGSRITNNGQISAFQTGIDLGDVNSTILNTGVIAAGQIGIKLTANAAPSGTFTVTNTGTVSGPTAVLGSAFKDVLTNEGVLDGAVLLGGGDDLYMGIRGSATSIIRLDGDGDADASNDPVGK